VYDDTTCMVDVAALLARFLWVESCGQCPPCKLGTGEIARALDDIASGHADQTSLETANHWLDVVADGNRCFLPVEAQQLVGGLLHTLPPDFDAHQLGVCPSPRRSWDRAPRPATSRCRSSSTSTSTGRTTTPSSGASVPTGRTSPRRPS